MNVNTEAIDMMDENETTLITFRLSKKYLRLFRHWQKELGTHNRTHTLCTLLENAQVQPAQVRIVLPDHTQSPN